MKRKSPESGPRHEAPPSCELEQSSKRPKLIVTAVTELKRIEPIRKQLGLRGKGLLQQKLKEQHIRLTQRQRRSDVLKSQLRGVKEYQVDLEKVFRNTEKSWSQLETKLRGVLMVRNTKTYRTDLPDKANTTL
jgi:superfamily II DNA helicase RecQ